MQDVELLHHREVQDMGDKGGKKDKDKAQKQKQKKSDKKSQKKADAEKDRKVFGK